MDKEIKVWEVDLGRKKICECGKVCFDKKGAQTKANWLKRRGNQKYLRVYQCEVSDYWHLTSAKHHFT